MNAANRNPTGGWVFAWIEREQQIALTAQAAAEAYDDAREGAEKEQAFIRWRAAVETLLKHKRNMPPAIRAAREKAALGKAKRVTAQVAATPIFQ